MFAVDSGKKLQAVPCLFLLAGLSRTGAGTSADSIGFFCHA